jgi:hypothetical protein
MGEKNIVSPSKSPELNLLSSAIDDIGVQDDNLDIVFM